MLLPVHHPFGDRPGYFWWDSPDTALLIDTSLFILMPQSSELHTKILWLLFQLNSASFYVS